MSNTRTTTHRAVSALLASTALAAVAAGAGLHVALAQVEQIVVTAEKRAETAQDVGIALTAVSGEDLRDNAITEPRDLFQRMPNVSIASNATAGQLQLSIRGINYLTFSPVGVQPVLIFNDEVVMGSPAASGLFVFDAERVEVLRGPQNTLYGRNTTGGAVNFVSRKPEIGGEFNGYADFTYGRFEQTDFTGAVGGPLGDRAAFRVALQSLHNDGYWDNLTTGDRQGDRDQTLVRGQLAWRASDALELLFNIHGGQSNGGQRGIKSHGLFDDPEAGTPCSDLDIDDLTTTCLDLFGGPTFADTDVVTSELSNDRDDISAFGGSVRADWDLGGPVLTSITAFEGNTYDHWEDADGIPIAFINFRQKSETDQWSQEFRLTSPDEAAVRWILGAFGLWEETRFQTAVPILLDDPTVAISDVGDVTQDTAMYSIFGQADFDITDRLTVTGGVRYVYEEKEGTANYQFVAGLDALDINDPDAFLFGPLTEFQVPGTFIGDAPFGEEWNLWGGKIGAEYRFADDVLGYAHVSRGVKAGQFTDAPDAISNGGFFTPADPEIAYSYEAGVKSVLFNDTLIANIAAFYTDYDNQQQQISFSDPATNNLVSTVINAAAVRTAGVELEAQWAPGGGWFADLSLGLLDTEVKEDTLAEKTGGALAIEEGRELTNSPKITLTAAVEKEWDLGAAGLFTARLDGRYTGERTFNLVDTAETRELFTDPSYFLLNGGATYQFGPDNRYRVSVFGKNLTDEVYHHLLQEFGIGNIIVFASNPRTFGVTLGVDF
ncbi:MAG: TonB-dependent receptor [Caulobacterales bacterium]|nr:TonB-dependent receptor [Caulobacterales bacterium]